MKAVITLSSRDYDAVLFDLDGVLTRTANVHASVWKKLFVSFLEVAPLRQARRSSHGPALNRVVDA
jgi:beta-phosphoglucomutase-like phosphatase (HAD superfamily)